MSSRALFLSCAVLVGASLGVPLAAQAQTLVHEYSFSDPYGSTNVADSVGGPAWDGVLMNGGTNNYVGLGVNGALTGSQLILSSVDEDFVKLPAGILSNYTAVTIDTWVSLGTPLPANCFLWGFGDTDTNPASSNFGAGYNYIFCQPSVGRAAITGVSPGWQGEQSTASVGNWEGQSIHVTAVFNPPAGYIDLYTNGVLASELTGVTVQMDQVSNVLNYLGRSLYYPDSYYDSSWDEFRIWDGALNALQVAGEDAAGPDTVSTNYGTITGVQLALPQYTLSQGTHEGYTVMATASALSHSVDASSMAQVTSSDPSVLVVSNNLVYAVGQGVANVIATIGGISSTQAVTAISAVAPTLMHRYSFTSGTSDSVGGAAWAGTLHGAATVSGGQLQVGNTTSGIRATNYMSLPVGIITNGVSGVGPMGNDPAVTVETWMTLAPSQMNWAYIWDFGVQNSAGQDSYGMAGCIHNGNGDLTSLYMQGSGGGGVTVAPGLEGRTNIQVDFVFNPPAGYLALYTNGVLMGKATGITATMADIISSNNIVGADNWPDPGMNGSVDEFRVWNGALSSQDIAISAAAGPDSIPSAVTNGPGTLLSFTLQAPSSMQVAEAKPLKVLANYTSLTNYDLLGNSIYPINGMSITSSDTNVVTYSGGTVTAINPGSATISVSYGGVTSTQNITVVQAPIPQLVHDYHFNGTYGSTTVTDSVGGAAWDGTVMGDGTNNVPMGGSFTNGVLYLSAANTNFVSFPSGMLGNYTAVTIEGWVTEESVQSAVYHAMWYSFGTTEFTNGLGYNYIFGSIPRDYTAITPGTYSSEQGTGGGDYSLPSNTPIHWVAVYNPPAGYIAVYTNGVLAAINTGVTEPMSVVSPHFGFIGRSLYPGDPYADIAVDEFRVYDGAMSPKEVEATQVLGPNQFLTTNATMSLSAAAGKVTMTWPAAAAGFTVQSTTNLTTGAWVNLPAADVQLVGGQWQVSVPTGSGNVFYRLVRLP